jgi:hypothetical protein
MLCAHHHLRLLLPLLPTPFNLVSGELPVPRTLCSWISPSSLTHQWFIKHIFQQSNVAFGLLVNKVNQQHFQDVYCKKGVNHNLLIENLVYKILPCVSLDDDSTIVRLSLSNLPILDDPDLLEGLNLSLGLYDIVHHVELSKDTSFVFFRGTGYAIINQQSTVQTKTATLTNKINYAETGESFHTTLANMPVYCRYCQRLLPPRCVTTAITLVTVRRNVLNCPSRRLVKSLCNL